MTRKAWLAVGGVSALALGLAIALVISLASGGDSHEGYERATGDFPPGGDQFGGPVGPPLTGGPPEELRDCLSDQGIELPEPGEAPTNQDQEALQNAFEACADELPEGGFGRPGGMIEP